MLYLISLVLACIKLASLGCASPVNRPYGTFKQPAARVRPRFRYWLPDASVDPVIVRKDIKSAASLGIGGVEFLPFYNYGGGTPITDWSEFGFGTPAFQTLFRAALETHRECGLFMDFAMGPNQGQGVPAEPNNPGLQWDLATFSTQVAQSGRFDQTIPGWGSGDLVAVVSAFVLSETNATIPPRAGRGPPYNYTRLIIQHGSLVDMTDFVSNTGGSLSVQFPSTDNSSVYTVFAFYQKLTHAKNLDPQKNVTQTIFDNGCYIVDHFDAAGANVMTEFWEQYILINGTKELLSEAGNSGWEDSMELLSNVSWSPSLLTRFEKRWGYSLKQYLPLIIFGNNNINIQSAAPGLVQCQLDAEDGGVGYINDYRVALAEGYQEYLNVLTAWTKSYLDLQYSSQTSYNLPMDMEASIPFEDVPECESLQFRDNVDSYRQFSGVAYLAQKNVVSIELGAVFGDAFTYTIPDLLFAMNRAASGGVNQFVIHGQAYTGNYSGTTWPGYVSFGYHVSDQYSEKRPDWNHGLEAGLRYMGRIMYVQQQGIPRIDVAFYNRQSATDPIVHTLYQSHDLQDQGWSYVYLSPDNFNLHQAQVGNGVLAPGGPAFKAIVIESSQNMTLDGLNFLSSHAASGIPIVLSGGSPGYFPSGNSSGKDEIEDELSKFVTAPNVYSVAKGQVANQLRSLSLGPRVGVQTNGTWFTTWREDEDSAIDYAYIFCDTNASSGAITVSSTKKPFLLNAWTGDCAPAVIYQQNGNTITIPLSLAGNETAIFAFAEEAPGGCDGIPSLHLINITSHVLGYNYSTRSGINLHIPRQSSFGTAMLSNGTSILINSSDVPAAIPLTSWTLTAEHWEAPRDFNNSAIVADKHNTTHELSRLESWLDIPQLSNVSGLGYYRTNFTWPPQRSSSSSPHGSPLGAYISLSKILDAVTVYINGERVPPLDYTNAHADISAYLRTGANDVLAVVPTTMWNYLQTLLPDILNAGAHPSFSGGPFGSPSAPSDNGLVGTARIIPFGNVNIS